MVLGVPWLDLLYLGRSRTLCVRLRQKWQQGAGAVIPRGLPVHHSTPDIAAHPQIHPRVIRRRGHHPYGSVCG